MRLYLSVRRWAFPALAFLATYFTVDVAVWLLAHRGHIRSFPPEVATMVAKMHLGILCFYSAVYGFFRVSAFHPVNQKGYLAWLRASPWHPGMKLPLGPAALVWWDAPVLLAAAALAHWHLHQSVLGPFLCFGCAYVLFSLAPLSSTFGWGAYVISFGLAFVARWIESAEIAAGIVAALLAFTQYALLRSFRGYPWEREPSPDVLTQQGGLSMVPPDAKPRVPTYRGLAGCALFGVWLWAVICLAGLQFRPVAATIPMCLAASMGLLLRTSIYCGKYHPPLTLLGRLRTGHLIIPGYDHVMLAPATVLPVAALLPWVLGAAGLPPAIMVAVTAATCLAILLIAPPSLRVWQLTGTHRAIGAATGQRVMRA